jgi:preprotein translocase SecE subunit
MAVAVKNDPEVRSAGPLTRPPVVGLVGTVYLIAALAVVFKLIPWLWWSAGAANTFVSYSLLGLVMGAALVGLAVAGGAWLRRHGVKGARAGIFVGFVGFLLILFLTRWVGGWFEGWVYDNGWFSVTVGAALTAAVGLALLIWGVRLFLRPRMDKSLVNFENQGWFSATSYKPLQGQRVRRGTIVGILLLVGSGVYTLIVGGQLTRAPENFELNIPFTGVVQVDLTPKKVSPGADAADRDRARKGDAGDAADDLRSDKYHKVTERVPEEGKEVVVEKAVVDRFKFKLLSDGLDPKKFTRLNLPDRNKKEDETVEGDYVKEYKEIEDPDTGKVVNKPVRWYIDQEIAPLNDILAQVDRRAQEEANKITPDSPDVELIVQRLSFLNPAGSAELRDQVVSQLRKNREKEVSDAAKKDRQDTIPPHGEVVYATIPLLPGVKYTLPLLLIALALWGAWRIVNLPTFADFLIATEAELNKVSWITRKKLIQDTIVVLVTVVLMAIFLFFMDQIWRVLLTFLKVLQFGEDAGGGASGGSPLW